MNEDKVMDLNNSSNVDEKELVNKIDFEREKVVKELKGRMDQTKFELLKKYLENEKIFIPDNLKTTKELMNFARKNLSKEEYKIVKKKKTLINNDVDNMINSLENGSTSAFSNKFKKIMNTIKSVGLTVAKPLALSAVLNVVAPPPLKIFTGAAMLAYSGYKLVKTRKKRKVANQQYGLSKMIREMEVTRNIDGKIVDTRFSLDMQEKIRKFLKERKIVFEDTGYVSLMNAIYSLDFDNKKAVCNFINNSLGNRFNIEDELKKYKNSLFDFSTVSYMTGVGLTLSNTINSIPTLRNILSSAIVGTGVGFATDSVIWGAVAGVGKGGLSLAANVFNIDYLKEMLNSFDSAVNTTTITAGFATLGLVGSLGVSLWNYIKGKKLRLDTLADNKTIIELDRKMYAKEIAEEEQKVRDEMMKNPNIAHVMIVSIVFEYIKKKGIQIPENVKDSEELMKFINQLPSKDRKDILKFYDDLRYYNKHNHSAFMKKVNKTLEVIANIATVGLAGASLYNIFVDHDFLQNVSDKIYGNNAEIPPSNVEASDEVKDVNALEFQRTEVEKLSEEFYDSNPKVYNENIVADSWEGHQIDLSTFEKINTDDILGYVDSGICGLNNSKMYDLFSHICKNEITKSDSSDIINDMLMRVSDEQLVSFTKYFNSLSSGAPLDYVNSFGIPYYWPSNPFHDKIRNVLDAVLASKQIEVAKETAVGAMASVAAGAERTMQTVDNALNEIANVGILDIAGLAKSIVDAKAKINEITDKKNIESFGMKK